MREPSCDENLKVGSLQLTVTILYCQLPTVYCQLFISNGC
jgi:hypothetical protein